MSPVFDPNILHELVRGAIGHSVGGRGVRPIGQSLPILLRGLDERFPGRVETAPEWILSNAGGAMGQMAVLYASVSEYLIVFGTPIGTSGHTGRFAADDYFFILEGEQWAFAEGELERSVFRPGDVHHLRRGQAKGYRVPDQCWALEYARGWIPLMLPFGLADTFTSTLDVRTVAKTLRVYASRVGAGWLRGRDHRARGRDHAPGPTASGPGPGQGPSPRPPARLDVTAPP